MTFERYVEKKPMKVTGELSLKLPMEVTVYIIQKIVDVTMLQRICQRLGWSCESVDFKNKPTQKLVYTRNVTTTELNNARKFPYTGEIHYVQRSIEAALLETMNNENVEITVLLKS